MFSATLMRGTVAFFSGSSGRPNTLKRSKWPRFGSNGLPWMKMPPSVSGFWPASTSTSALWPLPETPAMPTISPALTLRLTALMTGRPSPSSAQRPARSSTALRVVVLAALGALADFGVADHHAAHLGDARVLRIARAGQPAAPQHGEAVAEGFHLAELVADHQHGDLAALRHLAEQAEHLVGLAGRQHRSRLVEDQEALLQIEKLQDLELLLLAGRERGDLLAQPHAERHAVHESFEPRLLRLPVDDSGRVGARDDEVLGRRQAGHQRELLVDHADAEVARVARALHLHLACRRAAPSRGRPCRSP